MEKRKKESAEEREIAIYKKKPVKINLKRKKGKIEKYRVEKKRKYRAQETKEKGEHRNKQSKKRKKI